MKVGVGLVSPCVWVPMDQPPLGQPNWCTLVLDPLLISVGSGFVPLQSTPHTSFFMELSDLAAIQTSLFYWKTCVSAH